MKPLSLSRPHLIIMIGIPGAGKTTFAERFADTFSAPFINPSAMQLLAFGTRAGVKADEERIKRVIDNLLPELFKTKQTLVFEEGTGTRKERQELAVKANRAGYTPLFVWVQTDSQEAGRRSTKRKIEHPLSMDQFDEAVRRFSVPVASEKAIVISGKHTYASQLKNVLTHLAGERAHTKVEIPPRRNNLIR